LVAAAAMALYAAIFGARRIFEDRIADIAVKMRVTYGNPTDDEINSDSFARGLFRWVVRHLPEPELDEEEAEKLQTVLARAGFNRSEAVSTFNYILLGLMALLAVPGLIAAIADGAHGIKPIMAALVGAGGGLFIPLYYVKRRAGNRQRAISCQLSDILDLLV